METSRENIYADCLKTQPERDSRSVAEKEPFCTKTSPGIVSDGEE